MGESREELKNSRAGPISLDRTGQARASRMDRTQPPTHVSAPRLAKDQHTRRPVATVGAPCTNQTNQTKPTVGFGLKENRRGQRRTLTAAAS